MTKNTMYGAKKKRETNVPILPLVSVIISAFCLLACIVPVKWLMV